MSLGALFKPVLAVHTVPPQILAVTAAAALGGAVLTVVQGWPVWAVGLAVVLPWLPVLTLEIAWTYRHYHWLALFYVLVVTQGGHMVEHVVQMIQIHVLGLRGASARGVFGALDIEWVHFIWNSWVLLAVAALVWRFRTNVWLWLALAFATWHEAEHVVIMVTYLTSGVAGTPGLLAAGGHVHGGLPVMRPDLHFIYNAVETTPLVIGFLWQVRHAYDEWLRRALPRVPAHILAETTGHLQTKHVGPGQTIIRQGDPADGFYVVVRGVVTVVQATSSGEPVEIRRLGPGEYFGEIGLLWQVPRTASVRADTAVELLALDRAGFQELLARSVEAEQDLTMTADRRFSSLER